MTKKILLVVLVSAILSLCCGFCFAESNSDTVNLGNEVSSSLNKSAQTVGNVVDGVVNEGAGTVQNAGSSIENLGGNNNSDNYGSRGYNTMRTGSEGTSMMNSNGGMDTTTWMWVIFAIAAVIIIAAIWYYAMQGTDRD